MTIRSLYDNWLAKAKDQAVRKMLEDMRGDDKAIEDAFFKELRFGTGGLRGKIGAGTNKMNVYTVARATLGLADHVIKGGNLSVAIGYDSRNMSKEFARLAAEVMSSKGVKVYLFDMLIPTPVVSFAVRDLHAGAGIVITASHNPKEYNGYKVYNEKGCQITDSDAAEITAEIEKYGYFNYFTADEKLINYVGEELLDKFLYAVSKSAIPQDLSALPKIVYTPLNGTGRLPIKKLFEKLGVKNYVVVPEQEYPDGNFPTCPYPNPEESAALSLAVALAKKEGARLVVATDPDADRVGIATIEGDKVRLFNGNETGVLVENFLLKEKLRRGEMPTSPYIVKTIVTTPLAQKLAAGMGVGCKDVLTGFKYIGEAIDAYKYENFIFGMEESYGYLVGTHARDKDSVSAVMAIVEAFCYYTSQGKSLETALDEIYRQYGYYEAKLYYKSFEGKSGMEFMSSFMKNLCSAPLKEVCGRKVVKFTDYNLGVDGLPKSDVLKFEGEDFSLIVRPSGTEPKIKFYISVRSQTSAAALSLCNEIEAFVKSLA